MHTKSNTVVLRFVIPYTQIPTKKTKICLNLKKVDTLGSYSKSKMRQKTLTQKEYNEELML